MKNLLILLTAIFLTNTAVNAQNVPQGFNYQGVARDINDNVFVNQSLSIKVSIIAYSNSNTVYTESHAVTTSSRGVFNLIIGQGDIISGSFANISWGVDEYLVQYLVLMGYLQVTMEV